MAANHLQIVAGSFLQALGRNDDPLTFFVDVIKVATYLQFVTCGIIFYTSELWLHLDTGVYPASLVSESLWVQWRQSSPDVKIVFAQCLHGLE
jgi:hypothetical protein